MRRDYSWQEICLYLGLTVAVCVLAGIYFWIQKKIMLKKAATGEDQKKIVNIFKQLLPDTWGNYHLAYATWSKNEYEFRKTITYYWYYAVAFDWDGMYVVPLRFEGGELLYKDSWYIAKDSLGMVNGAKGGDWMTLYDQERKEIVTLQVLAENTKCGKDCRVNILQKEEAEAFSRLVDHWLDEVNGRNGVTVSGRYGEPFKK